MIAVVESRTRLSAETIGDSFKSILARMQSMKQNGFAQDENGNTTDVNQVDKALASVGINLVNQQTGQMRNLGTVLDELGAKWKTLTSTQQAYIATVVAGTYQQSNFENLMMGYDKVATLTQGAMDSLGTTQYKYGLYMQGTEAHLNQLKATMQGVWSDAFNSNQAIQFIDMLTGISSAIDSVVKTIGGFNTALLAVSVALMTFTEAGRNIAGSIFTNIVNGFTAAAEGGTVLTGVLGGMTGAVKGLTAALSTLGKATAVGLILTAVSWGLTTILSQFEKANEEAKALADQQAQTVNLYQSKGTQINSLVSQYSDYYKQSPDGSKLDTADQQKYLQIQQQLSTIMPQLVSYTDANGNAHLKSAQAVQAEVKAMADLATQQSQKDNQTWQGNFTDTANQITNLEGKAKDTQSAIDELQTVLAGGGHDASDTTYARDEATLKRLQQQLASYQSQLKALGDSQNQALQKHIQDIIQATKGWENADGAAHDYINTITENMTASSLKNGQFDPAVEKKISTATDVSSQLVQAGQNDKTTYQDKINLIDKLQKEVQDAGVSMDFFNSEIQQNLGLIRAGGTYVTDYSQASANLTGQFITQMGNVKDLNTALDKLNAGQALSADEIQSLIQKHPELANQVKIYNGQLTLTVDALTQVRNGETEKFQATLTANQKEVESEKATLQAKLGFYGDDLEAYVKTEQAKWELATKKFNATGQQGPSAPTADESKVLGMSPDEVTATQKALDDMSAYAQKLKDISNAVDQTQFDTANSSDKTSAALKKATQQTSEYTTELNKLDLALQAVQGQTKSYEQGTEAYRQSLKEEISLIQQKEELLQKAINNPQWAFGNDPSVMVDTTGTDITSTATTSPSGGGGGSALSGKLSGHWQDFVDAGKQYGIDPTMLASISMWETGRGTSSALANLNNAGGLMGDNGLQSFDSIKTSIEDMAATLANYASQGLTTIQQISTKYAPIGAGNDPNHLNNNWVGGVTSMYNELNGNRPSDGSGSGNTVDPAKMDAKIQEAKKTLQDLQNQEAEAKYNEFNVTVQEFDHYIKNLDDSISIYQSKQKTMTVDSAEYENEYTNQIVTLVQKQNAIHQEAQAIRTSSYSDLPQMVEKVSSLGKAWWDVQVQIQQLKQQQLTDTLDNMNNSISQQDNLYKQLGLDMKAVQDIYGQYSPQVIQDETQQVAILRAKLELINEEADAIKASGLLTAENMKKLQDLGSQAGDLQGQIEDAQANQAKNLIDLIKNAYKQQMIDRDNMIAAQKKALDDYHSTYIQNLDSEMKAEEDATNAKLHQMDELKQANDFSYNLNKEQQNLQLLKDQLNGEMMDNSSDGQSKRLDLQKQIANQEDKINKMVSDQQDTLTKQTLQDKLQADKTSVDSQKQAADQQYKAQSDSLDQQKAYWDNYYQNIIEDQDHWNKVMKDLMDGNTTEVQKDLQQAVTDLSSYANANMNTVEAHAQAILSLVTQLQQASASLPDIAAQNAPNTVSADPNIIAEQIAHQQQLQKTFASQYNQANATAQQQTDAHIEAVSQLTQYGGVYGMYDNTNGWQFMSKDQVTKNDVQQILAQIGQAWNMTQDAGQKADLHKLAQQVGSAFGWTYSDSKGWQAPSAFDTGGYTGTWGGDGRLALLHQKELVLNAGDTSNLLSAVTMVRSVASNIKNMPQPNSGSGDIYVDKIELNANGGTQEQGKQLATGFVSEMRKYGWKPSNTRNF